ncbi:hypothetical protein pipiens_006352 [Culex pipiens pipiens]|uniref:Uncharacterized protein n=1 Tax=Culex pipiens pipiens TaxID=38569 RepID=A0ABD1DQF5_CULPP
MSKHLQKVYTASYRKRKREEREEERQLADEPTAAPVDNAERMRRYRRRKRAAEGGGEHGDEFPEGSGAGPSVSNPGKRRRLERVGDATEGSNASGSTSAERMRRLRERRRTGQTTFGRSEQGGATADVTFVAGGVRRGGRRGTANISVPNSASENPEQERLNAFGADPQEGPSRAEEAMPLDIIDDEAELLASMQQTAMWNEDMYLELCPTMNRMPSSILYDENAEELSNPDIYYGFPTTIRQGNVTFTGDLHQLNPVNALPIYKAPRNSIGGSWLWDYIRLYELDQVMRQTDVVFSTILTAIGEGKKLTDEQKTLIESRFKSVEDCQREAPNAVWLFHQNVDVDRFNREALSGLEGLDYKYGDVCAATVDVMGTEVLLFSVYIIPGTTLKQKGWLFGTEVAPDCPHWFANGSNR